MGVDFGSGDGFVSEHILHLRNARTSGQQMSSKTVTQGVGAHFAPDTRINSRLLDDIEEHHSRQWFSA